MRFNWRAILLAGGLALSFAALTLILAAYLPIELIDFNHYRQASTMLWRGENPYGRVEFFAPPWLALFLTPWLTLPPKIASAAWVLTCVGCVSATVILSMRWLDFPAAPRARLAALMVGVFMPAALYVYITGQLSALAGLALVGVAWQLASPRHSRWGVALGLLLGALKPHVILLPALLCVLELLRRHEWKTLLWVTIGLGGCAAPAFVLLPDWPASLWQAWLRGDYRGGPGLVATGYVGYSDIGVSLWMRMLFAIYALTFWRRAGLTAHMMALAFAANLLLVPYSRSYDLVLLILPALTALSTGRRRGWVGALVLIGLGLCPLTNLTLAAPPLVALALLLSGETLPAPRRAQTNSPSLP